MTTGATLALATGALLAGVAAGPGLDAVARWSLREPADAVWRKRPLVTGLCAGIAAAAVVLLVPTPLLAPAWLALAAVGAAIIRTDAARHRIPDALSLAALASGAALLLLPRDLAAYGRGWLAAATLTGALLLLALIGPSGLGMGDVKLAPALGLYLGYLGWTQVLLGVASAFVIAAAAALAVLARDAVGRRSVAGALRRALPFGPFLLLGTLVGLAV